MSLVVLAVLPRAERLDRSDTPVEPARTGHFVSEQLAVSVWLSQQQLSFFRLFPAVPVSVFVLGGNVFGKAAAAGTLLPQPLQSACLPWQKQHLDLSVPSAAGLRLAVADFPILKDEPNFPVGFSKGSWLNRREDAEGLYL